jgi:threonylcarbamoyladenosine tRNA methylthiotransferase MtaB
MQSPSKPHAVRRAAIANLGCKVNQAEMDSVERLLRARGVELVGGHETADLVVVNTCTVTAVADRKSRQIVRRARRANPHARVLVTGCSVAVDPDAIAAADPEAGLFDNDSKGLLLAELEAMLTASGGPSPTPLSGLKPATDPCTAAGVRFDDGEGACEDDFDSRTAIDRTRAFVKIQDGCAFHCTYCIIPRARGPERSVPAALVLDAVRGALTAGHREVVLTGINAGTYSSGGLGLPGLVRRILTETDVERIRLSSIEPQHVTEDLLDVWAGSAGRCLPHFHVPLQSGDDFILRRMGRRYDSSSYSALVSDIRRMLPDVAVHADVIAGFPGEDDESWSRTLAFLRSADLAGIHVFRYSARPGTPAARMVGQVDAQTRKRRAAEAISLATQARASFAERQIGREVRVLFEVPLPEGRWLGHAENHVLVAVERKTEPLANAIGLVRLESIDPAVSDRVVGRVLDVDRRPGRHAALAERADK